jgi:parvulin-like peptidyl-prolyl isomerase
LEDFKAMMTRLSAGILIIVAAVFGMAGCGSQGDPVLAQVGDYQITVEGYERFYRSPSVAFNTSQEEFDFRRQMLDSLITIRLLIQAAYEKGIDQAEDVMRVVSANQSRFLLQALYDKHVTSKIQITDADLREFYNMLEYQIRCSHILLDSAAAAQELFERLKAGEPFDQLAYDHSIDPSAKRNRGDLGYFTWGTMVDEFANVAFAMEPGEIAPPFESPFGWHIVKMIDKKPNEVRRSFDVMRDEVEQQLRQQLQQRLTSDYFTAIEEKYPITLDSSVADYVMHKRSQLYPPTVLEKLAKNDFDEEQLDRNERELILATYDGGQVTLFDYLMSSRRYPSQAKGNFDDYEALTRSVGLVKRESILSREALQEGIHESEEYRQNLDLLKEYTMADVMRNDSVAVPPPPDETAQREYYENNREEFLLQAAVHTYEILVGDEMQARRLIREIGSLEDFKAKARELTERGGMRAKQGDLGFIQRSWNPDVFDVAMKTKSGYVGGPIPTGGKYSVVWPVEKAPAEYQEFLSVKRQIVQKMAAQQKQDAYRQWVEDRKATTNIEVYENVLWDLMDVSDESRDDGKTTSG